MRYPIMDAFCSGVMLAFSSRVKVSASDMSSVTALIRSPGFFLTIFPTWGPRRCHTHWHHVIKGLEDRIGAGQAPPKCQRPGDHVGVHLAGRAVDGVILVAAHL